MKSPTWRIRSMTGQPHKASQTPKPKEREKIPSKDSSPAKKTIKEPMTGGKLTKTQLQKALDESQGQMIKYKTQLAHVQADHENYVKSMERREANLRLQANRELILSLLPILDDLERAQIMIPQIKINEPFIEGFTMLVENLKTVLTNAGVNVIECKGKPFDPLRHEAVVREEATSIPPNTIIEELRKGYLLKGTLLRPSMVKIAIAPPQSPKADSQVEMIEDSAKNKSIKK